MKENVYGDLAADIDDTTPEVDAFTASLWNDSCAAAAGTWPSETSPEEAYGMAVDLARKLERERNEARWHADADVMSSIDSGSTAPDKKGWCRDCEADEYELRYAAKRGLIERHPIRPTWLRLTAAGKALL